MDAIIRPETSADQSAISEVNRSVFETGAEANLVDTLREGGWAEVSLVSELNGRIVGHILFSRVVIQTAEQTLSAVCLAPMAVLGRFQGQRLGTKLVLAGLKRCRERKHRIVVVLGHPAFYQRFGFSAELARPLTSPFGGGNAWMALELEKGALDNLAGTVEFSAPFLALK